jgi:hypothetical protein
VSDLHIGKAERAARRGGPMLPPYEGIDTLLRLSADIADTAPKTVVCLGDSFDDAAAADALDEVTAAHLTPLMAGRAWVWIEGNHDPGPLGLAARTARRSGGGAGLPPHRRTPARRARFRATTTPRHGSGRGRDRSRGAVSSWTTGA